MLVGAAIVITAWLTARAFRRIGQRTDGLDQDRTVIVAFSEELQRRIVDEQRGAIGPDAVLAWDARAYRRARLRLRSCRQSIGVQASLRDR